MAQTRAKGFAAKEQHWFECKTPRLHDYFSNHPRKIVRYFNSLKPKMPSAYAGWGSLDSQEYGEYVS